MPGIVILVLNYVLFTIFEYTHPVLSGTVCGYERPHLTGDIVLFCNVHYAN